jgi:hypothetical protein
MEQFKSWTRSTGVWGAGVALAAPIVSYACNVTITPDDMTQAVNIISGVVEAAGAAVALWGRIRATKRIA